MGCESVSYYSQAVRGHSQIIFNQQDINELIADTNTEQSLKRQLQLSQNALHFARQSLGLPKNHSYSKYVDTGRDYVVWNVVATPRFSVEAVEHCFPVAGCVSYRGYYSLDDARDYARRLKQLSYDVYIGGVSAYSTLGWFSDPLLNTMLKGEDTNLVATLIHEITHQQTYVKDDTAFNESFATAVEQLGLKLWLLDNNQATIWQRHRDEQAANKQVVDLILRHRALIAEAYKVSEGASEPTLQQLKERLFAVLKADFARLRQRLDYPNFDNWFKSDLNNASLVLFADYNRWVPAFKQLRAQSGSWAEFYAKVQQLADLDRIARDERLQELNQPSHDADAF